MVGCYVTFEDTPGKTNVHMESNNGTKKRKRKSEQLGTIYSGIDSSDDEDDNFEESAEYAVTKQTTDEGIPKLEDDMELERDPPGERRDEQASILEKIGEWWSGNMRKVRFRVEVNGKDIGVEQQVEIPMKEKDLLYPAASIGTHQHCHFNFGQEPFKYFLPCHHIHMDSATHFPL